MRHEKARAGPSSDDGTNSGVVPRVDPPLLRLACERETMMVIVANQLVCGVINKRGGNSGAAPCEPSSLLPRGLDKVLCRPLWYSTIPPPTVLKWELLETT